MEMELVLQNSGRVRYPGQAERNAAQTSLSSV
jgi:hypothetical protein